MEEKTPLVVILSGGMDSTTLLYDVKKNSPDNKILALSFNYGQRHLRELKAASSTCMLLGIPLKICDLSILNEVAPSSLTRDTWEVPQGHYADENMKQTVVPNRNMVMLSLAAAYAIGLQAPAVYYGAHSGDHTIYPDCRPEFVEALSEVVKMADWFPVEIKAPYLHMTKGDIAVRGKELGVDYSITWTCYQGGQEPCGKCGACVERAEAFEFAQMDDPLVKKEI